VPTQQFISKHIHTHTKINVFGGPFYYKNEQLKYKQINNSKLCVCFTSMGSAKVKGADTYHDIVDTYISQYPDDKIQFISIGNCPTHPHIKSFNTMSQLKLSEFYRDNVDVLLSLNSISGNDGFPLGIEAMKEGCVVLTTDVDDQNTLNDFNFDPFYIVKKDDINGIILKIKTLSVKDVCHQRGKEIQEHSFKLFNYENTMEKIFEFIV
jgi:glycosyltransferase involved in cell wall biosynthesis